MEFGQRILPSYSERLLQKFKATDLYNDIQELTGKPKDKRFNLVHALQQRESAVASFSASHRRYLWNQHIPNKLLAKRVMPTGRVFVVTKFNKSGSQLLIVCQEGQVRIFDASKGPNGYHLLNQFKACLGIAFGISDADFSPNGQHLAYSGIREFCLIPVSGSVSGGQWFSLPELNHVQVLRFSPTGDYIMCGSKSGTIVVTDVQTRATITQHKPRHTLLNTLCYVNCNDPNVFIAGFEDGLLKVFDLRSANSELSFTGHLYGIISIDPRNDGHHVLTSSCDGTLKIWDIRQSSTQWACLPPPSPSQPNGNVPPPDASIMTYCDLFEGYAQVYAKFSPKEQTGQRFIYTSYLVGGMRIYDVLTGEIRETIQGKNPYITTMDWHPERPEIVCGSRYAGVEVAIHDCSLDK